MSRPMRMDYHSFTTAMNLSQKVDNYRLEASRKLDPQRRSALGQFMTPEPVARFMASLFDDWSGNEIRLRYTQGLWQVLWNEWYLLAGL